MIKIKLISMAATAALLLVGVVSTISEVQATQPDKDSVVLAVKDCVVTISWVDGMQVAEKLRYSIDGVYVVPDVLIDDIVGDQSRVLVTLPPTEDVTVRAYLVIKDDETPYPVEIESGVCPTPVPTATAVNTATAVPTSTSVPAPTPVVIIIENNPPVQVPVVVPAGPVIVTQSQTQQIIAPTSVPVVQQQVITTPSTGVKPPSTGDAGLK